MTSGVTMDHYETLGIDRQASADEIKKAYRRKAAEAHPDRGGSQDAMAEVNSAYAVLIDPRRRQKYDTTGEAAVKSIQEQAQESLAAAFAAVLGSDEPDLVEAVRAMLQLQREELNSKLLRAQTKREKMLSQRGRVRSKAKVNIVHVLIDQAVIDLDAIIANAEEGLWVNALTERLLNDYESHEAIEVTVPGRGIFHFTFSGD